MLICKECGLVDSKEGWEETRMQMSLFPDQYKCPDCNSEDIVPAAQCAHCTVWCAEEDRCLTTDDDGNMIEVCQNCYDEFYCLRDLGLNETTPEGGES